MIVKDGESRMVHALMSWVRVAGKGGSTKDINKEHKKGLEEMVMHGQFFRQTAQLDAVDVEGGHRWLHTSHLQFETESLICAAQEQVLATNAMKAKVWKKGGTSLCRLCCKHDETVMPMVSGCEMLAGTKYLYRHDHLRTYLH